MGGVSTSPNLLNHCTIYLPVRGVTGTGSVLQLQLFRRYGFNWLAKNKGAVFTARKYRRIRWAGGASASPNIFKC